MSHRTLLISGTALFIGCIIGVVSLYHYTLNSDGNVFDDLISSSDTRAIYNENKSRMDEIHTAMKTTQQSFYIRPWSTGCINTTEKKCVTKSTLRDIDRLTFKTNPKFKQVEHIKDFGESTWFTIDERKHFDKHREIGIVLVDDPASFTEALHDSPVYESLDQLETQIREHPTATSYAFTPIESGVYVFYQYTPY